MNALSNACLSRATDNIAQICEFPFILQISFLQGRNTKAMISKQGQEHHKPYPTCIGATYSQNKRDIIRFDSDSMPIHFFLYELD